jgi:leader peptidase (prepilin peptidase) / N-methyltransferase
MSLPLSVFSVPIAGLAVAVVLALAGGVAGLGARLLLRRLRRGARVPPPWCEIGVAAAWGTTGAAVGAGAVPLRPVPVLLALGWLAVATAVVDVAHHRLPDALTLPALPLALVLLVPLGSAALRRGLVGATVAVLAYAAVHLAAPGALGAGDVKLAAPLGAVLVAASWSALVLAAVITALLTGGMAVVARARGRAWGSALPHGPPMVVAGWLVALAAAVELPGR